MNSRKYFNLLVTACLVFTACVTVPAPPEPPSINVPKVDIPPLPNVSVGGGAGNNAPHSSDVDLSRLPLGDGKYSTSPQVGYVFTCQTQFDGRGATGNGNWINADDTWDVTKKAVVDGSVTWPHAFTVTVQGDQRNFVSNDLPDHPTGVFPIASSDDAYAVDRNPNSIKQQSVNFSLPANPTIAAQPNCVGGEVGIMLSGVGIFSAFDAEGRDAPAHEVQDSCDGHPQASGFYHYHSLSDCFKDTSTGHSSLMGYAFDGFGIFGYYGEDGKEVTNASLDECHGHTHVIVWDGKQADMYHYHATHAFPYVVGCFKGVPSVRALSAGEGPGQPVAQQGGAGAPPQEAISACSGQSQNASCSFGNVKGTCQTPPNTFQLACVPAGGPP